LKKDDKINTGPLQDGMIISEHCLGVLSKITCVNANRITRSLTTGYQRPYEKRSAVIADISSKFKTDLDVNDYFSNLFLSKIENNKLLESHCSKKVVKKSVKKEDVKEESSKDLKDGEKSSNSGSSTNIKGGDKKQVVKKDIAKKEDVKKDTKKDSKKTIIKKDVKDVGKKD